MIRTRMAIETKSKCENAELSDMFSCGSVESRHTLFFVTCFCVADGASIGPFSVATLSYVTEVEANATTQMLSHQSQSKRKLHKGC